MSYALVKSKNIQEYKDYHKKFDGAVVVENVKDQRMNGDGYSYIRRNGGCLTTEDLEGWIIVECRDLFCSLSRRTSDHLSRLRHRRPSQ
ncbi:hypothetical protein L2E82_48585 [Cichorium intybus]|uniref:Uncharacterized protein n=1 Tax=Cichorium intybus TaxID=13427 RepID=A0ACB8YYX5_CICIN|nr:hypothetical protein L2E82_48585 [Cichorium intybus]